MRSHKIQSATRNSIPRFFCHISSPRQNLAITSTKKSRGLVREMGWCHQSARGFGVQVRSAIAVVTQRHRRNETWLQSIHRRLGFPAHKIVRMNATVATPGCCRSICNHFATIAMSATVSKGRLLNFVNSLLRSPDRSLRQVTSSATPLANPLQHANEQHTKADRGQHVVAKDVQHVLWHECKQQWYADA